jgi:hypothetical protein
MILRTRAPNYVEVGLDNSFLALQHNLWVG